MIPTSARKTIEPSGSHFYGTRSDAEFCLQCDWTVWLAFLRDRVVQFFGAPDYSRHNAQGNVDNQRVHIRHGWDDSRQHAVSY